MGRRITAVAAACMSIVPAYAAADESSLYGGPGPRPGPDILYAAEAHAPQLSNAGVWQAEPILVSGTTAYRDGEFLYQDFLYDDHGADGGFRDPSDPRTDGDTFAGPNGTYTYPTAAGYAGNAADLVELRVKPLASETAFRLTLNSLTDPELVGLTIAIGSSDRSHELPHGANVSAPAELFLTAHGGDAELSDAATGAVLAQPAVTWDEGRRQAEVRVPHSAWDPGEETVRLAAGIGLWDAANDRYLVPAMSATATRPGGAGRLARPAAFFNVAFRDSEPWPEVDDLRHQSDPAWWRDKAQAAALAANGFGDLHADVDFGKLAAGEDDNSEIPATGPMNRILASRFEPHQGLDVSKGCGGSGACTGWLGGQLQPYAIYVPEGVPAGGRYGLTLLLHSLSASYNQFSGSRNQSQFGEAGDNIVITPSGRGPDGWYYDMAAADTFEVWADVAREYELDPGRTTIAGYSMGGYGTYKLTTQYPDLFARAQPTVGPPTAGIWFGPPQPVDDSNTLPQLASLRHIPFMIWVASADELVPISGTQAHADEFDRLGLRYEFDVHAPAEHLTLAFNDQYARAAEFLDGARVVRDPAHVTFVANPAMDFPDSGTVADHAYWLSGIDVRDGSSRGTIDAISHGRGAGDPAATPTGRGAGVLTGGALPAIAYTSQSRAWGPPPPVLPDNRLTINAENVSAVTVHTSRAGVTCSDVEVDATTDGPLTVTLADCGRTLTFG